MTRVLLLLAVLAALITLLLSSGAPLASTDGWTWASPSHTQGPHGWKW